MLDSLLDEALRYAENEMRQDGEMRAGMMAQTPKGRMLYVAHPLHDDAARDDFVARVRMICAVYEASAVVIALESWVGTAGTGDDAGGSASPESAGGEEMVVLVGEGRHERRQVLLPVVRTGAGAFWGFGVSHAPAADSIHSRFAGLLPAKKPDPRMRESGFETLHSMGVRVEWA